MKTVHSFYFTAFTLNLKFIQLEDVRGAQFESVGQVREPNTHIT